MHCFVPFNNSSLENTFFVFKPVVVLIDDLIDALKHFSFSTEGLGCLQSSIFKSIHGNMIVWYGAWMKRSSEKRELLNATLISMLENVSSMAILVDHNFFDAYAGQSNDGAAAAKLSTGDTILISEEILKTNNIVDLSYACLALFKSSFPKMEGLTSGVCFKCNDKPMVATLYVWSSLSYCYSWLLNSGIKRTFTPYLDSFSLGIKYDIFRVVYISRNNSINLQFFPPLPVMEDQEGTE